MTAIRRAMPATQFLWVLLFGCGLEPTEITTQSLRDGTVGAAYGQSITATGDESRGGLLRTAHNLPPGLSVPSPDQGSITGTPTLAGDFEVTLVAWNEQSGANGRKELPLKIFPAVVLNTTSLPGGQVGVPYSATLEAQGGKPPLVFNAWNTLPTGLSLDGAAGVISGTPTQSGPSGDLLFSVTDANHANVAVHLTIGIAP